MITDEARSRLASWFATQLPGAADLRIDGFETVDFGHSAETLLLTLEWRAGQQIQRRDVVVRLRPPEPGLLPPYDLQRQFTVLRALEATRVRAPRALWHETVGDVLGREFYVMERLGGAVYEHAIPDDIAADPALVREMCFGVVDQLAEIHLVDLAATGLSALADGSDHVNRELLHWEAEIARLQRGPLPALQRLLEALRERQPAPCSRVTLVHGDAKPGNVAFVGSEVSAVFDWELATVGDPLTDIGWLELMWGFPVGLPTAPHAPTIDELIARYEELTNIEVQNRSWYRAMQGLKMAVVNLSASMLFDSGASDDLRFLQLGYAVHWLTERALHELGVDDDLEPGPVLPRRERIKAVKSAIAVPGGG